VSGQLTDLTQRKVGVIVLAGSGATERLLQQVRASPVPIVFEPTTQTNPPGPW
jgi:hypothetical protein